jgi:hypothetical protein
MSQVFNLFYPHFMTFSSYAPKISASSFYGSRGEIQFKHLLEDTLGNAEAKTGDKAPDFTLPSVNGETVSLADSLVAGHSILLLFVRHLG